MPALDRYHDIVKTALIKDGWTITHDPLYVSYADVDIFIDLGAERPIAAQKDGRKIAVEIKSFLGASVVHDAERAIGQYILYRDLLELTEPERTLYLALDDQAFAAVFRRFGIQIILKKNQIRLLVVHLEQEELIQWIEWNSTDS